MIMCERVSDKTLKKHLDNCDYWLDPCECQYDMREYAEATEEQKAELDKPEWCDDCQWWIDEKALIKEVQERRAADSAEWPSPNRDGQVCSVSKGRVMTSDLDVKDAFGWFRKVAMPSSSDGRASYVDICDAFKAKDAEIAELKAQLAENKIAFGGWNDMMFLLGETGREERNRYWKQQEVCEWQQIEIATLKAQLVAALGTWVKTSECKPSEPDAKYKVSEAKYDWLTYDPDMYTDDDYHDNQGYEWWYYTECGEYVPENPPTYWLDRTRPPYPPKRGGGESCVSE